MIGSMIMIRLHVGCLASAWKNSDVDEMMIQEY